MKVLQTFIFLSIFLTASLPSLLVAETTNSIDTSIDPGTAATGSSSASYTSIQRRLYTSISGGYVYSGSDFAGFGLSVLGGFNITENKVHNLEFEYIHVELDGDSTTLRGSLGVAPIMGLPPLVTGTYNSTIDQATIKENMILCNYRYITPPVTWVNFSDGAKLYFDFGGGIGASFAERDVTGITTATASVMGMTLSSTETTKTTDTSTEFVGQVFGALNILLTENVSLKFGIRSLFTRDFDLKVKRAEISNEVYQLMIEAGIRIAF
ncbi:MAG TPA: hypothetical protein DIU37_00605 [Opitutae bacterium]|nr:hypothetical protein [Opitutae bacterium]|tara:strand:+ start:246 stop:1046 length:801 start_codon:yes stop_codon:yes gene_type:complete